MAALKRACAEGELAEVKGFGEKTQQKILEGIERWERRDERVRLVDALDDAEAMARIWRRIRRAKRVELVGLAAPLARDGRATSTSSRASDGRRN